MWAPDPNAHRLYNVPCTGLLDGYDETGAPRQSCDVRRMSQSTIPDRAPEVKAKSSDSRLQASLSIFLPARPHQNSPSTTLAAKLPTTASVPSPNPIPRRPQCPFLTPLASPLLCPPPGPQSAQTLAASRPGEQQSGPGDARRRMYGRRASQLLKEVDSSEAGQLAPFNVIPTSLNSPTVTGSESERLLLLPRSCS